MIQVTVGNNLNRSRVAVSADSTIKDVCDANSVAYDRGSLQLNGTTLGPGDIYKTFADFGVVDTAFLINVQKMDNAA